MIKEYLRASRPQLWVYILGSFFIGALASDTTELFWPALAVFAFYFTFPANILLYGLNYATDALQARKQAADKPKNPLEDDEVSPWRLINVIILWNLPFSVVWLADELPVACKYALLGFLFFAIFYSLQPIRAKTKPFLDVLFGVVYIFPGLFAYGLLQYQLPTWPVMIAAGLWCIGLSAYMLIPRIPDTLALGHRSTATVLRPTGTLLLSLACFIGAGVLAYPLLGIFAVVVMGLLGLIILITFVRSDPTEPFILYRPFPYLVMAIVLSLAIYIPLIVK